MRIFAERNFGVKLALAAAVLAIYFIGLGACADILDNELSFARAERLLYELPRKEFSEADMLDAKEDILRFKVNGEYSSLEWITINDGHFEVIGFFLGTKDVFDIDSEMRMIRYLAVPETVSGLTVYRTLPLVQTNYTIVPDDLKTYVSGNSDNFRVEFSLQDKWLHAKRIEHYQGYVPLRDSYSLYFQDIPAGNFFRAYSGSQDLRFLGQVWFDVSDGEVIDLVGEGTTEFSDIDYPTGNTYAIAQLMIEDRLGGAKIFHSVQVHYRNFEQAKLITNWHEDYFDSVWPYEEWVTLQVKLEDENLVFVE